MASNQKWKTQKRKFNCSNCGQELEITWAPFVKVLRVPCHKCGALLRVEEKNNGR